MISTPCHASFATCLLALLSCTPQTPLSASPAARATSAAPIRIDITSDADSGLVFAEALPFDAVAPTLAGMASRVRRTFDDPIISSRVREIGEASMADFKALMVRGFAPDSGPQACGGTTGCEALVLRLETYAPGQPENGEGGSLFLRRTTTPQQRSSAEHLRTGLALPSGAFLLGSPVSLNVFSASMQEQSYYIGLATRSGVSQPVIAKLAAELSTSADKIVVKSVVSATPGSQCRSQEHPCRDNYFRLVIGKGRIGQTEELGSLFVRDFLNESDAHLDFAKILPLGERQTSELAAFEMRYASPISADVLEATLVRAPKFVKTSAKALLASANLKALRSELLAGSAALMVSSIVSEKVEGEGSSRIVVYSFESYRPGRDSEPVAEATVTIRSSGETKVEVRKAL